MFFLRNKLAKQIYPSTTQKTWWDIIPPHILESSKYSDNVLESKHVNIFFLKCVVDMNPL